MPASGKRRAERPFLAVGRGFSAIRLKRRDILSRRATASGQRSASGEKRRRRSRRKESRMFGAETVFALFSEAGYVLLL